MTNVAVKFAFQCWKKKKKKAEFAVKTWGRCREGARGYIYVCKVSGIYKISGFHPFPFSPWCAEQEPHTPAALKWHKGVWFWGSEQPQANTMTKGS